MSDDSSSQNSSGEEDFKSELHKKNLKQSRVNKQKPEVVDFLPALSVLDDDVNDQDVDEKNSLPKIKEEISDQELAPSPEVMLASCENGIVDHVVQILDKEPSLINCRDEDGYSPLHRASYNGHTNVVRILLQRGADVQARTGDGWQPLHCACRWGEYLQYTGKTDVASLLLQNGADINAQTNGRQTPLHFAASGAGGGTTLQLLLCNRWLDATIRNMQDETAYDIAKRSGKHHELFEIVEDCINVK